MIKEELEVPKGAWDVMGLRPVPSGTFTMNQQARPNPSLCGGKPHVGAG